mgnify:CR=1 FL=1
MADNNENKVLNVPHLRFPEFSGEWEEHTSSRMVLIQTLNVLEVDYHSFR